MQARIYKAMAYLKGSTKVCVFSFLLYFKFKKFLNYGKSSRVELSAECYSTSSLTHYENLF